MDNWVFKEMYTGTDKAAQKEYPIIIDSTLGLLDKAKKYFEAKDYVASSIYLRKELEKIVNERLPSELKYKSDGTFLSLQTLWGNMVSRYLTLGRPITPELIRDFSESKLMILNPQAHFQSISMPIYKVELEKAFELIEKLKANYPVPNHTLLLTKGTKLIFKHPTENYTVDLELLSDFYVDGMNGLKTTKYPKCWIEKWQYNGTEFWDFISNAPVIPNVKIEKRLDQIKAKYIANVSVPLGIDSSMFDRNTRIINSTWTLKELIDMAGITI